MLSIEELKQKVHSYDAQANLEIIERAFHVAAKAHEGQKRASGEPYFVHPVEVAEILAQMKLDSVSIAAGLLHDTVEDTLINLEDVKEQFGEEIARLVDGVTKLSKIKFSSTEEKQAENFRKMILAMASDIRVVLIKLADRIHNMRTLDSLSPDRQQKIASETLEIYAPLANRMGMQWAKVELEDLCLRYLKPDMYWAIANSMAELKEKQEAYMARVKESLEEKLDEYQVPRKIFGRLKHIFSIHRKMETQNLTFAQVHDIIAFRIIVENIRQCYEVLGILHEAWKPVPGRFKDYIAMPKVNNYRSLHTTVVCLDGQQVEFQIRTREMHDIAESGIAAHWKYKEDGSLVTSDKEKFQWLRELIDLQKDLKDPAEFLDTVKLDLFATDVYVFTPKGDLIELPYGSTPVDFAYWIHTGVGNACVGAKVDDRIVPLDYQLRSGDTVTILTKPGSKPKRDWLNFVKSSKARAKIRHEIQIEQRDKAIILGKDLLGREVEKYELSPGKVLTDDALQDIAVEKFHLKDAESLFAQVGYGKITPHSVVGKLLPSDLLKKPEPVPKKVGILGEIFQKVRRKSRTGIQVGGHSDILVTLGKCCAPLPGDSVTGFITLGRGVMVHRMDCDKVLASDPERRVEVSWERAPDVLHHAKMKVITVNRPGILANLTKKISNLGVNISEANVRSTNDEKAINLFTVEIADRAQLEQVMRGVESVKGVISVQKI
jgi:GTP pyrophosphokinase